MARAVRRQGLGAAATGLDIHSVQEFKRIIRYERARADRASSRFALVSVQLRGLVSENRELKKLIQALRRRIRATDVLGWLDSQTLSILLPGTDLKGTVTFTVNLEKQCVGGRTPLSFTIYCYPDHWFLGGNGCGQAGNNAWSENNGNGKEFNRIQRKLQATMARSLPVWKRTLDIGGALLALVISSPIFLIIAAYIKALSPGPVLFKQKRLGYRAEPFTFLKFRTMSANNDPHCHRAHLKALITSDKPMEKLDKERDPRIIPGGRVLRKTCIDELPQLVNVLKGDMSLVGPRPCLPYEAEEYLRWHSNRFDVLPGLTGLWQVSGKNKLTFKQMIRLDISYCQNMSLWLDLKILLRTVPAIVGFFLEGTANRLRRSARARQTARLQKSIWP